MALRFLEYLMVDGQQIVMYVMQVFSKDHHRCYKVEVHATDPFDFLLCKNSGNEWHVITQEYPEYIIAKLFEPLTSELEQRLSSEQVYMSPN